MWRLGRRALDPVPPPRPRTRRVQQFGAVQNGTGVACADMGAKAPGRRTPPQGAGRRAEEAQRLAERWAREAERLMADDTKAAGVQVRMPPLRFCTDNGAQIAALGSAAVRAGVAPSPMDFAPDSGMPLDVTVVH